MCPTYNWNSNTCIQYRAPAKYKYTYSIQSAHTENPQSGFTYPRGSGFGPGRFRNTVAAAQTVHLRRCCAQCSSHRQPLRRRRRSHPSHHPQLLPSAPRASPPHVLSPSSLRLPPPSPKATRLLEEYKIHMYSHVFSFVPPGNTNTCIQTPTPPYSSCRVPHRRTETKIGGEGQSEPCFIRPRP